MSITPMIPEKIQSWLKSLGYMAERRVLHCRGGNVPANHPYVHEIKTLLDPEGSIRAHAVFDVEGVPSVAFLSNENGQPLSADILDDIRKRIWNQNLVNIVIDISGDSARAVPARKLQDGMKVLQLSEATPDGPFSAVDVASANLTRRLPEWFDIKARVDHKLLSNLSEAVRRLSSNGFDGRAGPARQRQRAELLMGQILFLSYLEHREIVGETYRNRREVQRLHDLISNKERDGVTLLIDSLRQDFNGDFLGDDRHEPWSALNDTGFDVLDQFLCRTDMQTGQGDFWNYDFSFIPVELLSGLYESFLSDEEKAKSGAFYTPRHLAMLAVGQAFASSQDPLSETIFDGACGSGILLTTAYRRLIALKEGRAARKLTFKERKELLVKQIFGADINFMACRVSAFSLYLSLLEGLNPADIIEAQDLEKAKLPNLAGQNLLHGDAADFFNDEHGFTNRQFSLFICNPPWAEPAGRTVTSADRWAKRSNAPIVRRQIAGAFALRALDFLNNKGRVCLILPITQLLAPTSTKFVSAFLQAIQPIRLINFGDLQNLLFPSAEHTCHVFLGKKRQKDSHIPFGETFDYCVPKADMSLAYGRLTMQSADRHELQTISVVDDPQLLVTLMWGDTFDVALITRLTAYGTVRDFCRKERGEARWIARKGIHFSDRSRKEVSADLLKKMPHIPVEALSAGSPILHSVLLTKWPSGQATVVGLDKNILSVFEGPRILFTDGFSRQDLAIRAVYFDKPASFSVSIGVIAGPRNDAPLLKFLAVYLRSSLARYLLMMRAWKMLCERNALHLTDVENFPFFEPSSAPDPEQAHKAIARVCERMDSLGKKEELEQVREYENSNDAFDEDIFDYFSISPQERELVRETVKILMPSIRPRGYTSLNTPSQHRAKRDDVKHYAKALGASLTEWRKRTKGEGKFHVSVVSNNPDQAGPMGIVKITYDRQLTSAATTDATFNDTLALSALSQVREHGLMVVPSGDALDLVPETHIWINDELYFVRPLVRRNWTQRQAMCDAEKIVYGIQKKARSRREVVVA